MNIVLLSGGSGQRLWPLSNSIRSKQFLKLINSPTGEKQSMLQRVYQQLQNTGLDDTIVVATSQLQVEAIRSQLGDKVSLAVEPERRNTFPAIALACAYLAYKKGISVHEPVIILPVDPYVEREYFDTIRKLYEAILSENVEIALMGAYPTYPSEKYGYSIPDPTDSSSVKKVLCFREKPDAVAAERFIKQGGLWNCGVFAVRIEYVLEKLQRYISFQNYEDIVRQYSKIKKESFDYEVVEKAQSIRVIPYDGEWSDLGTWNTLTEVIGIEPIGAAIVAETCCNTSVINELEIPILALGIQNAVVVASPDGILVADKEQSSFIKKYVEKIHQRPMYEERNWGEYKVLDISLDGDGMKTVTKKKTIKAGRMIELERHEDHDEVWTVVKGKCVIHINGRNHDAFAGDTFTINKGIDHGLIAEEETILVEVQISY